MPCIVLGENMEQGFNTISNRNELADYLGISRSSLTYVLYVKGIDSFYVSFDVPKKSGGTRTIHAPQGTLKGIQKILLIKLYNYRYTINENENIKLNISHAFENKKSIITNARIHKNKRFIINFDLKDFFESFHFGRVKGYFEKNKYFCMPEDVARIIAQLTCYSGTLPQGAPTSPIITNLICQSLDYKILSLAKKHHLDYTRYADDLTFSTNDKKILENYDTFYKSLVNIIHGSGFEINEKKTRFVYKHSKQIVTGLVVNKKVNVDSTYYRNVRSMAHHLYTEGTFWDNGNECTINQLEGKLSFINQIDKYNNKLCEEKKNLANLNRREREYQRFLFYKNFYGNPQPVIITEGKTDILYIKAALRKYYLDYPELIEKSNSGQFHYKLTFFRRSSIKQFFFGMSYDGADAIKKIYNFFTDNDSGRFPNYYEKFNQISAIKTSSPIILLFDNELNNKNKPIKNFCNYVGLKPETVDCIKNGGFIPIVDNKLFLLTHQLVNDLAECEIEDLFDEITLNHTINGKTFSRQSDFDIDKHYGKEIFSKHIISHYESIDFSNFKPLLNSINQLIAH